MFINLDDIPVIKSIDIEAVSPQSKQKFWLHLTSDGIGTPLYIPVIIIRGRSDDTVVGITAVLHGNELNGISVTQKLINAIDPTTLNGVLVCVPVSNVPGFLRKQRNFSDGGDLNQIMPGDQLGNESQVYAHRFISRIINELDYVIDLHTASFGNINSFFVRANMNIPEIAHIAYLLNPQIIVHKEREGTLRNAAESLGVHAITVELGDPNRFQQNIISDAYDGIMNLLICLNLLDGEIESPEEQPVECEKSYWLHTDKGGLLEVYPNIMDYVEAGQKIARVTNIFGDEITSYVAPEAGIVIEKNINPVNPTGGRIFHLGIPVE